jgi:hypothetical protein
MTDVVTDVGETDVAGPDAQSSPPPLPTSEPT